MKWNIPGRGVATSPPISKPTSGRRWNIPTSAGVVPVSTSTWQRAITPTAQAKAGVNIPKLYEPSVAGTFTSAGRYTKTDISAQGAASRTALDYFNRYAETALSTLGALSESYVGFAWDKNTWGIAKSKIKDNFYQIWSPPALTEEGEGQALGRAIGNVLSLAGQAIVTAQMGRAVVQTGKQIRATQRMIWSMKKLDEVLTAADGLKSRVNAFRVSGVGKNPTVMPDAKSYETLVSSIAKASETPTLRTMGQMMSDYATALNKARVVSSTYASTTPPTPPTAALARLTQTFANPATQTNIATFINSLPPNIVPGATTAPLTVRGAGVPVGQATTTTPAKPVTALAEIPKAVPVGQPHTVSGGAKPQPHRYQIPATAIPAQISPVAKISPQEASVPTVAPTIAPQIAPVEIVQPPAAPTISKMEIPPSTEQPSVVPLTRDSLIGYQEDWGPKRPKWEIVGFNKAGAPLWRDVNHPEPGRLRVLRSEDATWVKEQLALKNRTPEQVAQDEAQRRIDNKRAAEIISGAFNASVVPTGKPTAGKKVTFNTVDGEVKGDEVVLNGVANYRFAVVKATGKFAKDHPYRIYELSTGRRFGQETVTRDGAIREARETLVRNQEGGETLDDVLARTIERQKEHYGLEIRNPQYVVTPQSSVTNLSTLPAGQTTSGEEVTPMNTAVEPSATSGTSPTIPADADSISRITVAFNKLSDAKKAGGIKKQNIDAFYRAMSEAGVPPRAIFWKKYHMIEHMRSPEKQMETVRAEVEKYNAKVLGKKITDIAHVREAKRAVKEAVATVKGQSREQIAAAKRVAYEKLLAVKQVDRDKLAESQRRDAEILKKQRADDVYLRESAVAKQKAHDDALLATTKKRDANLAKTLDRIQAEKDLKAREKEEAAAIIEYLTNLDLRNMHAQEAREIQTAVAGVVELKHPFVKQGDIAFSWLMQGKGIHVVDATIPATAQKTLNLPELRALKAKVKALADLSTEERDAIRVREKEALGKEIDDCTTELSGHSSAKKLPAVRKGIYHGPEKKTAIRAALDKVHEVPVFLDITFDRMQYAFQILGGYKKGKVWHSLYNKIYAADRATAQDVNAQMELAHERLSSLGITAKTMGKLRTLPNGITVTQRDALFAAVYAGNGDTLEKIMAGNGWTEEDISLAIKSMSKEEVAWTNYMLDDMRMMYPLIADAYARTNQGASLPDILNYFPAISQRGTDVFLGQPGKDAVHPAEQMTIDSLSFYGWGKEGAVGDKPSFVKRREGGPQVLQVDPIRTYFTYKEHALDYIHRAPVVATMRAIVNDKNFKDEYILAAGEQRYAALVEYVDAISNPQKALAPKTPVERVARILRWNASAGTLGGRVSKAITAFMSYGLGWGRYGPSAMAVGSYQLVSNFHGSMGTIKQYAPLLYQRLADPARWDALIAEAERAWGGGTQLSARKLSNLGFAVGDTLDVASSFLGYTWDLLRKHPDWTLEQASYEAEQDILQTHTSRLVQDRPPIYRQTELGQALVAFTGEATSQSMALMYDAKSAFHGKTSRAKFIAEWFTLTMGVTLMGMAADAIARGRKKKTAKELGFWGTVFGRFILAQIDMFPLVGRWVSGSLRGFTGQNDLITLKAISEAQQLIPDFIKAVGDQNPAYLGKAGLHLLRFIGYGLGMPVLGVDEFKNWIHPDNPAPEEPTGSPSIPRYRLPTLPSGRP